MGEIVPTTELGEFTSRKFVRMGERIFYSENLFVRHQDIAEENGVTEKIVEGDREMPLVDDAGAFRYRSETKRYIFYETTSGTRVKGDPEVARRETIRVAKGILGEDSVSDTISFKVRPPEA